MGVKCTLASFGMAWRNSVTLAVMLGREIVED